MRSLSYYYHGYSNRGVFHDHIIELRDITNSEVMINSYEAPNANPEAERNLVVRSSLRSKLPPMLIIKSANLRVLDSIGQGNGIFVSCLFYHTEAQED